MKPRSISMRAAECRDWLLRDFSDRRGMPKDLLRDPDWADMRRTMGDMIAAELEALKCDVESGYFPKSEASALALENLAARPVIRVARWFLAKGPGKTNGPMWNDLSHAMSQYDAALKDGGK